MTRLNLLLLLADRTARLDDLTRLFRERRVSTDSNTLVTLLIVAGVVIFVFWVFALFTQRHDRRPSYHRPWQLLLTLSRAHHLRWAEILFLWQLARYQNLDDPARLFLEPDRLTPEQAGPVLGERAELMELLRNRLFAGLHDEDSSSAGLAQAVPSTPVELSLWPVPGDTASPAGT
jgi:hypothetical protein